MTAILGAIDDKLLDLLLKLVPNVTSVGYLVGGRSDEGEIDQLIASARILKRQVIVVECTARSELRSAFAMMVEQGAGAVIVSAFPIAFNNREEVIALAAEHRLPAIYAQAAYVHQGGLMSYTPVATDRQLAIQYVAKILNGAKPAESRTYGSVRGLEERASLPRSAGMVGVALNRMSLCESPGRDLQGGQPCFAESRSL